MRLDTVLDSIPRETKVRVEHECEECMGVILPGTIAVKVKIHTFHGYAEQWGFYHPACHKALYGDLPDFEKYKAQIRGKAAGGERL